MSSLYPWQRPQWEIVLQQWRQNRLPHALLCIGPKGLGKKQFALRLAQKILCKVNAAEPCGQCRDCHLFKINSHPDFYPVTLNEKSKQIKIDQIRELTTRLNQTAHYNGYQIALVEPAQHMNRASANALLKTLEEPPGAVLIILVADELQSIPATILSRCQRLNFTLPEKSSACLWLINQPGVTASEASRLLQMAGGAPLQALTMAQNNYVSLRNSILKSLWQILRSEIGITTVVTTLLQQEILSVVEVIFSLLLDVLRFSLHLPERGLNNPDCQHELHLLSEKVDRIALATWLPECLAAKARLKFSGLNVQLLLESLFIQWQKIGKAC